MTSICDARLTRFRGTHSAEHILVKYEEIISLYELQRRVGCIVTDNASNVLRAFVTLPGMDAINCIHTRSDDLMMMNLR